MARRLANSGCPKYLPCIASDLDEEGLERPRRIGHEWIGLAPVEPSQAQTDLIRLNPTVTAQLLSLDFGTWYFLGFRPRLDSLYK